MRQSKTAFLAGSIGSVRNLNVHEHISMELFNQHGIATPAGAVAFSPDEAKDAYVKMGSRKFWKYIFIFIYFSFHLVQS